MKLEISRSLGLLKAIQELEDDVKKKQYQINHLHREEVYHLQCSVDDLQKTIEDKNKLIASFDSRLASGQATIDLLTEAFRNEREERKGLTETILTFCNIKNGEVITEVKNNNVEKAWDVLQGKRGRGSILSQLEKRAHDLLEANRTREEKETGSGKLAPVEEPALVSEIPNASEQRTTVS